MIYLIHSKNLWKCHNVPPPSTKIKGGKFFKIKKKRKATQMVKR
jgi:hypothetical protein